MEVINSPLKGMYRDILTGPGNRILYDSGWRSNTIVDSCRILLAGFVRNGPTTGIHHLAVGQGDVAWDQAGIPPTDPATTVGLINGYTPAIPVADLELAYLDAADSVVVGPTNRLQISATLAPGYPPPVPPLNTYPLREFGLFAQFDGADYMINCIRHAVIHKEPTATMLRVIRLFF